MKCVTLPIETGDFLGFLLDYGGPYTFNPFDIEDSCSYSAIGQTIRAPKGLNVLHIDIRIVCACAFVYSRTSESLTMQLRMDCTGADTAFRAPVDLHRELYFCIRSDT